jgi:hypothetical protein
MLKTIIKKIDPIILTFDKFGEPVAALNMKGKDTYKTRVGGIFGFTIYALMLWFLIVRC